jgi:hypothetical protein
MPHFVNACGNNRGKKNPAPIAHKHSHEEQKRQGRDAPFSFSVAPHDITSTSWYDVWQKNMKQGYAA